MVPATGFQPVGQDAALAQARDNNVRSSVSRPLAVGDASEEPGVCRRGDHLRHWPKDCDVLQRRARRATCCNERVKGGHWLVGNRPRRSTGAVVPRYPDQPGARGFARRPRPVADRTVDPKQNVDWPSARWPSRHGRSRYRRQDNLRRTQATAPLAPFRRGASTKQWRYLSYSCPKRRLSQILHNPIGGAQPLED